MAVIWAVCAFLVMTSVHVYRFMLAGSSPQLQARSPYASLDVRLTNETLVPQQQNERYGTGTNTNTEAFRAGTLIEMR
jgi:hypothetical protein